MGRAKANEDDGASNAVPTDAESSKPAASNESSSTEASNSAAASQDKGEDLVFQENEIVLAKDTGKLYDAKILRLQEANSGGMTKQYFIHYVGWNAKWDKWVKGSDLLKNTEENRQLQKELAANKKRGAEKKTAEKKEETKRKKTDFEMDIDEDTTDPQVKLNMPFTLKKQLVDDWEMITREPHQLVPLPRTPSAATILSMYVEQKKEKNSTSATQLQRFQELMEGIRLYFDKALPLILLYRHEREQYERAKQEAQQSDKTFVPSDVYGAEHLLRLFVRLPNLLFQAAMSPQEVQQVQSKLTDFLKFLQKNHTDFFLTLYKRSDDLLKPQPLKPLDQNGLPKDTGKAGIEKPVSTAAAAVPQPTAEE